MFTPLSPLAPTPFALPRGRSPVRRWLSQALYHLSRRLGRMALQLASSPAAHAEPDTLPSVEFHAEAGAPEGALYIDGLLVGHLAGVSRL